MFKRCVSRMPYITTSHSYRLQRLEEKRISSGRSSEIMDLSCEQLLEEKLAVQKALLTLENTFGRPVDPTDRDLVRPLYQRYRALKRMVIRTSAVL